MPWNKRDSLLQSIKTSTTVTANGVNYGDDIDLEATGIDILNKKLEAVFRPTTAFAAGNFTIQVYSGDSASPTTLVAQGVLTDRLALGVNTPVRVPIPANALGRYTRIAVNNAAISATGAGTGELVVVG